MNRKILLKDKASGEFGASSVRLHIEQRRDSYRSPAIVRTVKPKTGSEEMARVRETRNSYRILLVKDVGKRPI